MNAQDYIVAKLDELKEPLGLSAPADDCLEYEIVRMILSKKFRKYSAVRELIAHIKKAVRLSVGKKRADKFHFSPRRV
jgi:hypothetical protein